MDLFSIRTAKGMEKATEENVLAKNVFLSPRREKPDFFFQKMTPFDLQNRNTHGTNNSVSAIFTIFLKSSELN